MKQKEIPCDKGAATNFKDLVVIDSLLVCFAELLIILG